MHLQIAELPTFRGSLHNGFHSPSQRVMSVLPRWHTQRCGRCQNSRYLYGQRDADYPLDADYVFGQNIIEHNPAPSPSGHPLLSVLRPRTYRVISNLRRADLV